MAGFLYITSGRQMASLWVVKRKPTTGRLSRAYDVISNSNENKKLSCNKKLTMAGRWSSVYAM